VEELGFQVSMDTIDGVLRGRVEFNSGQRKSSQGVATGDEEGQRPSSVDEVDGGDTIGVGWDTKGRCTNTSHVGSDDVNGRLNGTNSVSGTSGVETAGKGPFAGVCVVPWWANEGVSQNWSQLAINSASLASSGAIITFLTLVSD